MIESESARKYLLCAIVEILRVMTEILLALQLNNWNKWKKRNNSINDHLIILHQNLLEELYSDLLNQSKTVIALMRQR